MRLKPRELEPPVRGELRLAAKPKIGSAGRPQVRAALLVEQGTIKSDGLLPLFDAVVLQIRDGVITIQSTQLHWSSEHRLYEHAQIWQCHPVR
jgi:hypothetical protein